MKKLFLAMAVLGCTVVTAQTQTENYIKTTTYQKKVKEGQQSQVLESDKIVSVNYFDGLGRAKQSVAVRAGGQAQGTNILDWTGDWTVGTGSTPLFNHAGRIVDNKREFGSNPFGEQSLLWRCGNTQNVQTNAGWNSDHFAIDNNVAYRYQVWIKRTGPGSAMAYHGIWDVNYINDTSIGNPYFLNHQLPNANTWYLLVGMVYPHDYTGGSPSVSGIYDIHGNKIIAGRDFKWKSTTTTTRLRDFYYDAGATNSYAHYWNPTIIKVDSNQQPIAQLLEQSKPKDIVTHYAYDDYGRQAKSYLPYASAQTKNGAIHTDPLTELNTFYYTDKYGKTTNPYSETIFEQSPLNRAMKQAAPGADWIAKSTGDDHTIKFDWKTNEPEEVVYFKVNFHQDNTELPILVQNSSYNPGELYVTITKDENWKGTDGDNRTTREYKDKQGRVILKRTYNGSAHDTYYVYDRFGNLTYVVPPKVDTSNGVDSTELNELCYQYIYDYRNRLVEKKIPGKGTEYIIYNKLDQPILTQDAVQRPKKEWLFTKYDAFGRVIYTGLYEYPIVTTRAGLQQNIDAAVDAPQFETKENTASVIAGTPLYYSNRTFPGGGIQALHTINYYDDYTFDTNGVDKPPTVYGVATIDNAKGLPTATKVRILGTNQWTTAVTAYDHKSRPIWTGNSNAYLNATDFVATKLDFVGKPLEVKTTHHKDNNEPIVTVDKFTYDHMGRVVKQTQKINTFTEEMIAHNTYDDLGQMVQKKVGNAEQAPLQAVDYKYNVRGWLAAINDGDTANGDLFGFKINYNTSEHGATALYNGNISETQWKTANDNAQRWYTYSYDALNRILSANSNDGRYNLSGVSYDKNGNILSLQRTGAIVENAEYAKAAHFGVMDNLSYTYDKGNKLMKVDDIVTMPFGFKKSNSSIVNNNYTYDSNGNLTTDRNKGINEINYNHLNLPNYVDVWLGNPQTGGFSYYYDALGTKLSKRVDIFNGGGSIFTQYAGNYIYKNGELQFFNTPEGYVEPENDGTFSYVYQFKDHLGSVRLSYADNDNDGKIDLVRNATDIDGDGDYAHEIREEINTYPFGLRHKGYNDMIRGRDHQFGYLNQEEQNELGLGWLTFRYRNYMPEIGRFFGVDPVSSEYMSISTFQFAHNNPVWKIEIEGLEGESINEKDKITHEPVKVQQARGNPWVTTAAGSKVVQETTKEVTKRTFGRTLLNGLSKVAKVGASAAANTVLALLSTNKAHAPGNNNPIDLSKIDEKFQVDDKTVKTEGDSDSPVVRMGSFDKDAVPSLQDDIDFLKETSTPGRKTKGKAKQFEREGGIGAATEAFHFLNPENIKELEDGTLIGTLSDGSTANVRTGSRDGRPTLEILKKNGRSIKFRFNEPQ